MQFCRLGTVVTGVAFDEQLAVPKANFAWDRGVFFIVACLSSLGLSDLFIRYFMRTAHTHTHWCLLKTMSLLSLGVLVLRSLTSVWLWIAAIRRQRLPQCSDSQVAHVACI